MGRAIVTSPFFAEPSGSNRHNADSVGQRPRAQRMLTARLPAAQPTHVWLARVRLICICIDAAYLLGLLAMLKCSICSYQCGN